MHKRPTFSTRVASHVSGRETRVSLYSNTLYEFEVTYDGLASVGFPGLGSTSLQTLLGFYLSCQGQFGTFLYTDPSDNSIAAQVLGVGDGLTSSYLAVRSLGQYTEPVSWVAQLTAVYINGVAQTGWVLTAPNIITLAVAPLDGSVVTADFSYAFVCRFLDDQEDFENIMRGLWQVQSLKFRSVKP